MIGGGEKKTFAMAARYADSEDIKADQIPDAPGFLVVGNPDSVADQIKTKVARPRYRRSDY
jgi:hypothetical protein